MVRHYQPSWRSFLSISFVSNTGFLSVGALATEKAFSLTVPVLVFVCLSEYSKYSVLFTFLRSLASPHFI